MTIPFRLGLLALVAISLTSPSAVSGQTFPRKSLREAHLEQMDDPPATIVPRRLQLSPQKIAPFGPYTSYQVNVDANGNNILGDAANEPSICVDPTNPNRMSIGWRQFNSVSSNFRQAGWGYTTNGGVNWTFPGVLENNVFRSDPVLNSDATGRFFYLSLLNNFFDDMWFSATGGANWFVAGPATGGDKQWFTIDNTPTSPGYGFQYQCWSTAGNNYQGRQFSRSTNGGSIWRDPVNIPRSPIWGTLDVDTNGNVFIGGVNPDTGQIWCIRSTNAKNAAVTPAFDLTTAVNMGGQVTSGENINPEGLIGQINLAIDHSGTSTNNNIYLAASLQRNGVSDGSDVMFVRSTNGGQSFSAPVRINDDPLSSTKWHWFTALSVAPNGRIDCVWFDTRNAANNTDSQLFYSFSLNGGVTWSPNIPVSDAFNPLLGYPRQNKIGDYITVVSDNNGANVAYSATFNGEQDVYYLRIATASIQTYNVSLSAVPGEGGSASGGGSYPGGSTVNVMASANANYRFVNWTENGAPVSTSPIYTFSAGADRTLVANFEFAPQIAAAPVFSPAGGTFRRRVKVRMLSATPGATIYYTLDGSDPTTASPVYPTNRRRRNAGIPITGRGPHVVKAMATASGFVNSPISTTTFTIQ